MKPCFYSCGCLAPEFCTEGKQECHINAYAEQAIRDAQALSWVSAETWEEEFDIGGIRYRQSEPYTPKWRE